MHKISSLSFITPKSIFLCFRQRELSQLSLCEHTKRKLLPVNPEASPEDRESFGASVSYIQLPKLEEVTEYCLSHYSMEFS